MRSRSHTWWGRRLGALGAGAGALGAAGLLAIGVPAGGAKANPSVTLKINLGGRSTAISPLIYGINDDATIDGNDFAAATTATSPSVIRLGGNRWTAWNWTNGFSNAGNDYCFENDQELDDLTSPGDAVKATIDADVKAGRTTVVTIPIQGYVSADDNYKAPADSSETDTDCPQDVRNSGAGYLSTRFDTELPSGPLQPTPSAGTTVYENQFIDWLKVKEPKAKLVFSLDNEPEIWNDTHAEVHPNPTTYTELVNDDLEYAAAIKSVLPNAEITGPVLASWEGQEVLDDYDFYEQTGGDYNTYGNFTDYWLKQVAAADKAAGTSLISDFDIHWYPADENNGSYDIFSDKTDRVTSAEREQRPRSLWDLSYTEHSYITNKADEDHGPIDLLPLIKGEIAKNDPGTNLDVTEWDYGASKNISGAIADADTLGIFGRYGVHLATFFPQGYPLAGTYAAAAFRIFRDYDGKGGAFGDRELSASTTSVTDSSVYASTSSTNANRLVIVAINKNTVAENATIDLQNGGSYGTASTYVLTGATTAVPQKGLPLKAGVGPKQGVNLMPTGGDAYSYQMPAQSITVIVPLKRTSLTSK